MKREERTTIPGQMLILEMKKRNISTIKTSLTKCKVSLTRNGRDDRSMIDAFRGVEK